MVNKTGNIIQNARLFVFVMIVVILCRLFYLQVIDKSYVGYSQRNSVREIVKFPIRGEITDRNGVVLAKNREAFDLMITPRKMSEFDTAKVAMITGVDIEIIKNNIKKAYKYSKRKASVLVAQLSIKEMLMIEELNVTGFHFVSHPVRNYPQSSLGNVIGYMSEVSVKDMSKDSYYTGGDYKGTTGLELTYEAYLRGEKGYTYKYVDVHGTERGDFNNRENDIKAVTGSELNISIDSELQSFGAELMNGKIGSIVAIEPSTGEILAMISTPTFDSDSLVGNNMVKNYKKMNSDPRKPLFNRSVMGGYPPGSTFKMANALIGLESGVTSLNDVFECNKGWSIPGRTVKCHYHSSPLKLEYGIQTSCNAVFCSIFRRIMRSGRHGNIPESLDYWSQQVKSLGFGVIYDTDIPNIQAGSIPTSKLYNRRYGRYWNDVTVISLSIGQGEIAISPLQMANFCAVIANRGYYFTPHLGRTIDGVPIDDKYKEPIKSNIASKHFEPIVKAMWKGVNVAGTGTVNNKHILDLDICGKTGTAQNGKGDDHSTFIAFAPKNNPKIAICVYVEHGVWGSTYALPIATLMIEKYLKRDIVRVELAEYMKNKTIDYPQYQPKTPVVKKVNKVVEDSEKQLNVFEEEQNNIFINIDNRVNISDSLRNIKGTLRPKLEQMLLKQ